MRQIQSRKTISCRSHFWFAKTIAIIIDTKLHCQGATVLTLLGRVFLPCDAAFQMAVSTCAFSHKVSINAPCAHRGRSLLRTAPRWRALSIMKATPQEGRTPLTPESSSAAPPAPKSTGDLAKEALIQTLASNEAMTVKDVLGESGLASLRKALGEERAGEP